MVRYLGHVLIIISLSACGGGGGIYSPDQVHRTVQLLKPGVYIVDYKRFDVINEYGPGVENVRASVDGAKSYEAAKKIWHDAVMIAVPKYLAANGLVPAECAYGVEVTRSGATEGGGGWAEFKCAEASH